MPEFVTPPPLERGDRVAIVAPSSGSAAEYPHVYELGLERLREVFDLEPVEFPTATTTDAELAADPARRAADLEAAFEDPEIGGVVTTIGGADQLRVLAHLDPEVLRANPTRFYGYSDSTNLALYLWNLGIVSYQGPSVMTELAMQGGMHEYTVRHCERAFFDDAIGAIEPAEQFTDDGLPWDDPANLDRERELEDNPGWRWAVPDEPEPVTGRAWGGCLEILAMQLMAGRYLPDPGRLDGAILFFETSELLRDAPYVEEVLCSMGERGLLELFDAVVVGRAKARNFATDPGPEARREHRERQRAAVREQLERYRASAPILFDFEFGHTDPIVPVPVGAEVTVDPVEERVVFH